MSTHDADSHCDAPRDGARPMCPAADIVETRASRACAARVNEQGTPLPHKTHETGVPRICPEQPMWGTPVAGWPALAQMTAFEDVARGARQLLLDRGILPPLIVLQGAGWSELIELYAFPADLDRQHTVLTSLAIERALTAPRARSPLQRLMWISEPRPCSPVSGPPVPASLTFTPGESCASSDSLQSTAESTTESTTCAGQSLLVMPPLRSMSAAQTAQAPQTDRAVGVEPHVAGRQELQELHEDAGQVYGALEMALTAEGVTWQTRMLVARPVRDVHGELVAIDAFSPSPPNPLLTRLLDTYRAGYRLARRRLC